MEVYRIDYNMTVDSKNRMNRAELITEISRRAEITKEDASKALTAFIDTVIQAMHEKREVQLVGFCSFYIGSRSAITARNPRTGEKIQIPATNFPKFKAGKLLKDAVK